MLIGPLSVIRLLALSSVPVNVADRLGHDALVPVMLIEGFMPAAIVPVNELVPPTETVDTPSLSVPLVLAVPERSPPFWLEKNRQPVEILVLRDKDEPG